jgi:hypothetical protein
VARQVIARFKVQVDQRFVQHQSHLPGSNPAKLRDMSDAPTQVAPGVHRLGNAYVNCYLIEDGNDLAFAADSLQMLASLDALERSDAERLLFGHGEPWKEGSAAAVARAREVGLT